MIMLFVYAFFGLCAFALVYWGVNQLTLPPMVKVLAIVLMGLAALLFLWQQIPHAGLHG